MAALAATALLPALGAKAEVKTDMQSYWYGYYMGAGQTVCALLDEGYISEGFAKVILRFLAEGDKDVPQAPINQAFTELTQDDDLKGCPLPRK